MAVVVSKINGLIIPMPAEAKREIFDKCFASVEENHLIIDIEESKELSNMEARNRGVLDLKIFKMASSKEATAEQQDKELFNAELAAKEAELAAKEAELKELASQAKEVKEAKPAKPAKQTKAGKNTTPSIDDEIY